MRGDSVGDVRVDVAMINSSKRGRTKHYITKTTATTAVWTIHDATVVGCPCDTCSDRLQL